MPIYEITADNLKSVPETSFAQEGIRERNDLQRLLRSQIDVLSPDTLVIAEEFGEWEESRRRIDLLGIDRDANLVVIELKRTEDGGHMELQAIRYAAMISTLTFEKVVEIFGRFLHGLGEDGDPRELLLEFLEWDEVLDDEFAQDVKILLASAEFSRELTSSVIWLNNNGLDIRCIRLKPYNDNGRILLDVQQVIPLPEAEDYQIQIRKKVRLERDSRNQNRDLTKFTVSIGSHVFEKSAKRWAIFHVIKHLADEGINPEELNDYVLWRTNIFLIMEGQLSSDQLQQKYKDLQKLTGKRSKATRWFIADEQLIYANGKTYALTKMWGTRTKEALDIMISNYKNHSISYTESD